MIYNQLIDTINNFQKMNNYYKLESLNDKRTIISLRNKQSLYSKFVNLISQNNIPRLNILLSSCLKRNIGINGII